MKKILQDKKSIIFFIVAILYCVGVIVYAWISSENTKKDLMGFQYELPFILGSLFLIAGSLWLVWLICVKKAELHNIYLAMSFVVLSLLVWTQTPLHHHDNQFHYDSTYVLSNILLGQEESVGIGGGRVETYYRRECDQFMQYASFHRFIEAYADMQQGMFSQITTDDIQLIETKSYQNFVSEPLYFYLPQALGFVVARVLNLNVYWLLYLGRVFVAAACSLITWRAIKNTPVYKEIFLICGMIPTTILSYVTVSRDALILAFGFYYASKCFQIAYSEEGIKWWDYILLFASLLLLAPYKFVYIPFVLLLGIILYKKRKPGKGNRKLWIFAALVLVIVGIFFVALNYEYIKTYLTGANKSSLGENAPFTISYVLMNPIQTLSVVGKTIVTSTVRYTANLIAIGDYGGGIHKEMVVVEAVFIIIMILQTNKENRDKNDYALSLAERSVITLTWLAISGMIFLAYLMLTPYTNDVIIGIQGRYFTPAFPLMIISLCSIPAIKNIKNKYWTAMMDYLDSKVVRQSVLLGIYGLAIFVAVNMYVYVMTYIPLQ